MENQIFDYLKPSFQKHSDLIALISENQSIRYGELLDRINVVASKINASIPDEMLVAISCDRSVQSVVNLLAVLSSGKTYIPIDFDLPSERLRSLVNQARVTYFLPGELPEQFEELGLKSALSTASNQGQRPVCAEYAYVLFTSGSTGTPKGVCMPHRALLNLVRWQECNSSSAEGFNTLQFAKLTFDVSFQEIFCTLSTGGTLVLASEGTIKDSHSLLNYIVENRINRLFVPFVVLQGLANAANAYQIYPHSLKEIMTAGEQLKVNSSLRRFFSNLPKCSFFNQYGPTESHVITQLKLVGEPCTWDELPTIGKPIQNSKVLLVGENGSVITRPGEVGELYLSGICLAGGYLNMEELSAEKFIMFPVNKDETIRVYKSGDLGSWTEYGEIIFSGRKDDQVKVNGFRIELAEVELAASKIIGVEECAVLTGKYADGQLFIKLFYTTGEADVSEVTIREELSKILPAYMVPTTITKRNPLPKTTSGKVDRKKLSEETVQPFNSNHAKTSSSRQGLESELAAIWDNILPKGHHDRDSNFFSIGGNSILAQKLSLDLKEKLDIHFPVALIYQYPSIKLQAGFLSKNHSLNLQFKNANAGNRELASKEVAVIAMSGKFPGADNTSEFWQLIKDEKEGITQFADHELDPLLRNHFCDPNYVKARGVVKGIEKFDAGFFDMNPKIAALMDPQHRLFLEICYEAMEKAGWIAKRPDFKIGVFAGTNNNTYYTKNIVFDKEATDVFGAIQVMTLNEKDYIATRTAFQFNLKGPAVSVQAACSTSLLAVAEAVESIRSGQCTAALAGGASVTFPVNSGQRYEEGAIFSKDGKCKPFDAEASGTVFSDGAGVVLLKDYAQAKADGDDILAVIKGVGISNDGSNKASFSSPSILGQAEAVSTAISDANVSPSEIGYIETHGTATPIGDPIEIAALQLAFGSGLPNMSCAIGSVKSNVGHLTAAAGIAGLIKTIYALKEKTLPASLGYSVANPEIDFENSPFYVQQHTKPWENRGKRIAGISSFGIGGTNVHLIVEEHLTVNQPVKDEPHAAYLACYSAKTKTSLSSYAEKLLRFVRKEPTVKLEYICSTLNGRFYNYGLSQIFTFSDLQEFAEKLERAANGNYRTTPVMGYFENPVFMFPGQGSQYVGMGKTLYKLNKVFREEFSRCCNYFDPYLPIRLDSVIFEDPDELLSNTRFTQPAIFAVSYALAKMLQSFGFQPAALCGHSIGEYVAAHLAGVFSLADVTKVVAKRGELIGQLPPGQMLSVNATIESVKDLISTDLSIAAINGPDLCVVAGEKNAIDDFQQILYANGIDSHVLKTSHAFHSHMMDDALEKFSAVVATVERNPLQIPVMSTQTGNWLTDAEAQSVVYWTDHIRNQVDFNAAFTRLTDELPQAYFIESGPGNVLNTLGLNCKNGANHPFVSCLNRKKMEAEEQYLYEQIGVLMAKGANAIPVIFQKGHTEKLFDLPTYSFDKSICWNQNGSRLNPEFLIDTSKAISEVLQNNLKTIPQDDMNNSLKSNHHFPQLKKIIEEVSGIDLSENDLGLSFFELGLDSLIMTQLAFSLRKEFKLEISFRQLNESYNSPGAILEAISGLHKQPDPMLQDKEIPNTQALEKEASSSIMDLQRQLEALSRQVANLTNLGSEQPAKNVPSIQDVKSAVESELSNKPFGAIARIERNTNRLSPRAKRFLKSFELEYNTKTRGSKRYAQDYRKVMADPRVVTGFKPAIKEMVYPIVTEKSNGSKVTDIDGNEYLDWLNGFGSNIFGYSPEFIVKALRRQLDEGYEIGPQHVLSGEVASLFRKLTNNERVAFCNTGSEAVLGAIRIARTVSSKPYIVSFTGAYHGIIDEALVRTTKSGKTYPAAPGVLNENVSQIILLEYGSEDALRVIMERANEIAGVLVEPVQSRRPEYVPMEFLQKVRNLTDELDICLIFDEVITGFRAFPGGVQEGFGITADLATYGKVVGGGLPIGVIGGKAKWMDALDGGFWQYGDDSIPPSGVTYFAGTFVRHPLALAAAKASLQELVYLGPVFQDNLANLASELVSRMNEVFHRFNVPYYAVNYRSLWKIKTKDEFPYWELLFTLLRKEGIHIWENFPCFVTAAHTQEDVDFTVEKLENVLSQLIENEIVEGDLLDLEEALMDIHNPPFKGAIIGLDEEGNPCWIKPN